MFLVLGTNIEWQRFSLLALTLGLGFSDYRKGQLVLKPMRQIRPALLFVIFLSALCVFAVAWLLIEQHSLRTVRNWSSFCIIGLGAVRYLGWRSFKLTIFSICSGIILSALILVLHVHFPQLIFLKLDYDLENARLALFMESPNDLGAMAGWGCVVWFFLHFNKKHLFKFHLDWLLLLILAVPLFLSGSRANMIGTLAIVIFMGLSMPRFSLKKTLLTGVALIISILVIHQLPEPDNPQLGRVVSALKAPHKDRTFISRLPLWEISWRGYLQSPLYGNGLKSYTRLHKEMLQQHGAEFREKYPIVETNMHRAHNMILGVMTDMGTIGLILFIGMYASGIVAAWRVPAPFKIGLPVLLFYLVAGLVDCILYETWRTLILFSACGGTLAGYFVQPDREFTP